MAQENGFTIPIWLGRAIVPLAITAAMGAGFNTWRVAADTASKIQSLERRFNEFAGAGPRFTSYDGDKIEERLRKVEQELARVDARLEFEREGP